MNDGNPYRQYMYSYPHKTAYRPLAGVSLKTYAPYLAGQGHGLYLHLPFCRTKCGYCNLFSVTGQKKERIDRYLKTVERQSRQYQEVLRPYKTVFSEIVIGGGTPLLLTEQQLAGMFEILENCFHFAEGRQLMIETAPGETSREKLAILKAAKVTRISMGIQSFSDEELRTLRRHHSAGQARKALAQIKEYNFPCVNVDFIYGIPGQTADSLLASLEEALCFEPEEIFLYPLYIKHGAKMQKDLKEGMVLRPEAARTQYREACRYLRRKGFRQESMRRFVRGPQARIWSECGFGASLALGCGGRSYLGNLHFCTPYAITKEDCLAQLDAYECTDDFTEITHGILLSGEESRRRYVIRHLLIRPGLLLSEYKKRFGTCAMDDFPVLKGWEREGFVRVEGAFLTMTDAGLELSDNLGPQLISNAVREKMEEWERLYERT